MDVSVDQIRSGADRTYQAAAFADDAAQRLSAGVAGGPLFGEFPAADAFHRALTAAHSNHERGLAGQRDRLGALADTALTTGVAFVAMDERNAAALRDLR